MNKEYHKCAMGYCNKKVTHVNPNNPKRGIICSECEENTSKIIMTDGGVSRWAQKATQRAKDRNKYEVEINHKDILEVWPKDNKCPIMKTKFTTTKGYKDPNRRTSPSLDRIKSEVGYVIGNIQVISDLANKMKQNATEDEIKRFCEYYENSNRNT